MSGGYTARLPSSMLPVVTLLGVIIFAAMATWSPPRWRRTLPRSGCARPPNGEVAAWGLSTPRLCDPSGGLSVSLIWPFRPRGECLRCRFSTLGGGKFSNEIKAHSAGRSG
jgi:hypothetical protein